MAYERAIRWLEQQGAIGIDVLRTGRSKHPRLVFHWRGDDWSIPVSGSPRTQWRADRNTVTELRHAMGLVDNEKTVGARRTRRMRNPREVRAHNHPEAQQQARFVPSGTLATLADIWPARGEMQ